MTLDRPEDRRPDRAARGATRTGAGRTCAACCGPCRRPRRPMTATSLGGSVRPPWPARRRCSSTAAASPGAEAASDVVALRFVALADKASQAASHALVVQPGERLVLLESHEGRAGGYVSDVTLDIAVGEGASLERIVLVDDDAEAVNVVTAEVALALGAALRPDRPDFGRASPADRDPRQPPWRPRRGPPRRRLSAGRPRAMPT
ncbi:hypothetical protein ACRAWD_00235 [Caulobacter segnis]